MSATTEELSYNRWLWAMYVAFAATPFALFLVTVWVFMGSDEQLHSVLATIDNLSLELVDHAVARADIAILGYSMHFYVHVIVSFTATFYFLLAMRNHARARSLKLRFEIGFATLFALVVCVVIAIMTVNRSLPFVTSWSVFSGLFIEPYLVVIKKILRATHTGDELLACSWEPTCLLYVSILGPALSGALAVIFCAATFHHIVCSRRQTDLDQWRDDIVRCVTMLKRQLTILSLVLVTSVLVTRAYVDLVPSLLDPDKSAHKLYSDLGSTLSFAGSMLFTATLFAAFAPGVVLLSRDLTHLPPDEKRDVLMATLKRLNISKPIGKITSVAQAVITLAAPALAGLVAEVLN